MLTIDAKGKCQMIINSLSPGLANQNLSGEDIAFVPSQTIRKYVDNGIITSTDPQFEIDPGSQIQPASIDLRLGAVAYELRASFLPGGNFSIDEKLRSTQLNTKKIHLTESAVLLPGNVYLVELLEALRLPSTIWAKANPRSTTGRADLFARLLCDYTTEFEGVPPGYAGKLYAEIVPRTFPVLVKTGTRVNQLRFCQIDAASLDKDAIKDQILAPSFCRRESLSVDLTPEDASGIIGYKAKKPTTHVLEFDRVAYHNPLEFWEPIRFSEMKTVLLEPDDFYIFRSYEKVCVEPELAAELAPFDPSLGEFRVHYAGFLDPGFGYSEDIAGGTPVVLEVRARDVPFLIEHRQSMAWVYYYKLAATPDKLYGADIGSSYQSQGIALGKQFKRTSLL